MGGIQLRRKYEEKLEKQISKQFLFHLGRNEEKRTKDLNQVIENLRKEMAEFDRRNQQQSAFIESLQQQLKEIADRSKNEKDALEKKIRELQHNRRKQDEMVITIKIIFTFNVSSKLIIFF